MLKGGIAAFTAKGSVADKPVTKVSLKERLEVMKERVSVGGVDKTVHQKEKGVVL